MTKRECAIVMAFTGTAMLKGDDLDIFYQYLSEIMGRPVYTHEIGILADEIKESARDDFIKLCSEAACDRTMTNGDRIRKMTDEELSEFFAVYIECRNCPLYDEKGLGAGCKGDCKAGATEWLKQEAKDDAEV